MWYDEKEQENLVKGHNDELLSMHFYKFRAFGILQPNKQHVLLKVLTQNKVFYSQKGNYVQITQPSSKKNRSGVTTLLNPQRSLTVTYLFQRKVTFYPCGKLHCL